MREAWRKQAWEATSWTKIRGPAGAVLCGLKDHMKITCPGDTKKTLLKHAKDVYWQTWAKKHEIEELKKGVWFEPVKAYS